MDAAASVKATDDTSAQQQPTSSRGKGSGSGKDGGPPPAAEPSAADPEPSPKRARRGAAAAGTAARNDPQPSGASQPNTGRGSRRQALGSIPERHEADGGGEPAGNGRAADATNQPAAGRVASAGADEEEQLPAGMLDAFKKQPALRGALWQLQALLQDSTVLLRPSGDISTAARAAAKVGRMCTCEAPHALHGDLCHACMLAFGAACGPSPCAPHACM